MRSGTTALLLFFLLFSGTAHANEALVRSYFQDTPVLIAIAKCESGYQQFKDGRVNKNPHSSAIGVMQIMSSLHDRVARRLGFDIHTTKGNLAYAKWLYRKHGTSPWNASRHCWKHS